MGGFSSPNHTQTPNDLFDKHMADMGESELKVTLAIIRQTLGYHKKSDPISLTQLQKMTGLSRQGAFDGAQAAINRGLVEIVGTGKRGVLIYGLVIGGDQSTTLTSEAVDQSTSFNSTGLPSRHTKETSQKKEKKEIIALDSDDSTVSKKQKRIDPMFEAIATVWKTRAGGYVVQMKSMFLGTAKRGDWRAANFDPPATPEEILRFGEYAQRRMRKQDIKDFPTVPATIQRWFYDMRAELNKPAPPPAADIEFEVWDVNAFVRKTEVA